MCVRGCDSSKKAERRVTWGVQVLRSPNLFKKTTHHRKLKMQLFSQRNHPVDIHIFHNAHATIAWPQQTLLQEILELERTTYNCHSKKDAATRTTITTLNMYTYHQILQILMPSFRILVFRNISLGKPQILHSYFSMLTRLDDREGLYLYSYNGMVFWYRLCECFYLRSRTFETILMSSLPLIKFGY